MAASVGLVIAFDWRIFVICAIVFFGLFFLTHYVSLCSVSAYFDRVYQYDRVWADGILSYGPCTYYRTLCCDGSPDSAGILQT